MIFVFYCAVRRLVLTACEIVCHSFPYAKIPLLGCVLSFFFVVRGAYVMLKLRYDDIIYGPLPLYHSAGGMLGAGQVLLYGCTAVLRKKFSASAFWTEAVQHQCTVGCSSHFRLQLTRVPSLTSAVEKSRKS